MQLFKRAIYIQGKENMNYKTDDFEEISSMDQLEVDGGVVTLAAIGIAALCTIGACFVVDVADTICEKATGKGVGEWIGDFLSEVC
jgi:hypothetical protein